MVDEYVAVLQLDSEETEAYYRKSVEKTEQQKFLERLLSGSRRGFSSICDACCGGGTLTLHLKNIYPSADFTLVDLNNDSLQVAKELNGPDCRYLCDDIYNLSIDSNQFDLVCCWQSLSWLPEPQKALNELIRITDPGGVIYLSSLFNLDHDVDIYATLHDHARKSFPIGIRYNTLSKKTITNWIGGKVSNLKFHKFSPSVDLHNENRGLGTYTRLADTERLQISAGYLMNWAVLEINL